MNHLEGITDWLICRLEIVFIIYIPRACHLIAVLSRSSIEMLEQKFT